MNTYHDGRDLPEDALSNAINIMCDIPGQVRQMSKDRIIEDLGAINDASITPGKGLFAFNSDYRVDGTAAEVKLLALHNNNNINIYDTAEKVFYLAELILGDHETNVAPVYYYTDGGLRVCDGNISGTQANVASAGNNTPRHYRYISKTWFPGEYIEQEHGPSWNKGYSEKGLDSFIYPPTVGLPEANTQQTLHSENAFADFEQLNDGTITIKVTATGDDSAEWIADAGIKFGMSFVYAGTSEDTDQESTVTIFPGTFVLTETSKLNFFVRLMHAVGSQQFDPRIKGCKFYWTADSLGEFEDPLFLAYFHWGTSTDDPHYLESHSGSKDTAFTNSEGNPYIENTNALVIPSIPVLPYGLLNPGQKWDDETVGARYKTAVIVNRRTYIGNVKRIGFNTSTLSADEQRQRYRQPELILTPYDANADRILKSPVDKFDIFPASQSLDIALNDGDKITAMATFADRILQFKTNTLYILNVSGDYEYVEGEHPYKGVENQAQVIRTEDGIAWANKNGCFIFDEDGKITNLLDQKIGIIGIGSTQIATWKEFVGNSCMVGYLPAEKQLIIFENPAVATGSGELMIYDFLTQSWTRGEKRVAPVPKTNVVTDYNNKCIYATISSALTETINFYLLVGQANGIDASWIINKVDGTIADHDSQLKINSEPITNLYNWNATAQATYSDNFGEFLKAKIIEHSGEDAFDLALTTEHQFSGLPDYQRLTITRDRTLIDGTYNGGALAFDPAPSNTQAANTIAILQDTDGASMTISTGYDTHHWGNDSFSSSIDIPYLKLKIPNNSSVYKLAIVLARLYYLYENNSTFIDSFVNGFGNLGYNVDGEISKTAMVRLESTGAWNSDHDDIYINLLDNGPASEVYQDFVNSTNYEHVPIAFENHLSPKEIKIYYPSLAGIGQSLLPEHNQSLQNITIDGIMPDEVANPIDDNGTNTNNMTALTFPPMAIHKTDTQIEILVFNEVLNYTEGFSVIIANTGDTALDAFFESYLIINAINSAPFDLGPAGGQHIELQSDTSIQNFAFSQITFIKSAQSPAVQLNWDSCYDYVVSPKTLPTIVAYNAVDMDIEIGEQVTGARPTKQQELIKPHRHYETKPQYDSNINYDIQIDAQNDETYSFQHITTSTTTDWDIASEFQNVIYNHNNIEQFINSAEMPDVWVASIEVADTETITVSSTLLKTDYGWEAGDCFKIIDDSAISGLYKINPTDSAAITELGGNTIITIATNAGEGADGAHIKDSIANGIYNNITLSPAFVVIESFEEANATGGYGNYGHANISGLVSSGGVVMREFNNSIDLANDIGSIADRIVLESPEYIFDDAESIKKFYSLSATYLKSESTAFKVSISLDNNDWDLLTSQGNITNNSTLTTTTWNSNSKKKFSTLKFKIEVEYVVGFKLTDVSIKYRVLGIRP